MGDYLMWLLILVQLIDAQPREQVMVFYTQEACQISMEAVMTSQSNTKARCEKGK